MSRLTIFLFIVILLSGCATTDPEYHESKSEDLVVEEGMARIYFFRGSRFIGSLADASIYLNENKIGESGNGMYFYTDVTPGTYVLEADSWGTPGTYELEKEVMKNQEYYFEVKVDESYLYAGMFLGVIGQATHSGGYKKGGGWILEETSQIEAKKRMVGLSFSTSGE